MIHTPLIKTLLVTSILGSVLLSGCTRTVSHDAYGYNPNAYQQNTYNRNGYQAYTSQQRANRYTSRYNQVGNRGLVFPAITKAWRSEGIFPNRNNLSKINSRLSKDQLYNLIGSPHFSEGFKALEWDYIMKFYRADNSIKICQYKVLFDRNYHVSSTHWMPLDCAQYAKPQIQEKVIVEKHYVTAPAQQPIFVNQPAPQPNIIHKKLTLAADTLFKFNKASLSNMLPRGRIQLDNLVDQLRTFSTQGDVRIHITGHTDYKGTQKYNRDLSRQRAQTVASYLATRGINRAIMQVSGAGEDYPVKQCPKNISKRVEIACLQENRRVEIDVMIYQQEAVVSQVPVNQVISRVPVSQVAPMRQVTRGTPVTQIKNTRYVQTAPVVYSNKAPVYQQRVVRPVQQQPVYIQR